MQSYSATEKRLYPHLFSAFLLLSFIAVADAQIAIKSSSAISNDGSFTLSWQLPANTEIELQQSNQALNGFKTIYTGADLATVITGLTDGNYFYRARIVGSQGYVSNWSPTLTIKVQHHAIGRAFAFFLLGAVVFVGLLVLILLGGKITKQGGHF